MQKHRTLKQTVNIDSMKKIILTMLCAIPLLTGLYAQEQPADWRQTMKRNEFSLSIGDPAFANLTRYAYFSETSGGSWLDIPTSTDVYTTCPITLSYRYRLLKWLWLGGDISYCGFFGTSRNIYTGEPVYRYRENSVCIMPAIRFSYLNREHVTLYSGFASGLKFGSSESYNEKSRFVRLPFQLTLFGVSAGSQSWFGFAEFGVGNEGFAKAGFGYRFNAKRQATQQ